MIGDWQYSVTEGRQCVSDQEQCCWPGRPKPRGDQYPAVPMCTVHAKVTAHQMQITDRPPDRKPPPPIKGRDVPGVIYCIQVGDHLKIGHAQALGTRLKAYPPTSIIHAVIPGTMRAEMDLHRRFRPWRIAAREWYDDRSGELARWIAEQCEAWPAPNLKTTQTTQLNRYSQHLKQHCPGQGD